MTAFNQNERDAGYKLITQLFDTQPDAVVWFIPKFEGNNPIPADFEVGYCNTAATFILNAPKHEVIGAHLKTTSLMDPTSRLRILEQCLEVWQTGESVEYTYYSPGMNKHFNVQRSKTQNGILSITRDHTAIVRSREEKEQQALLLNQIIETSPSGISLYEAMRNKDGKIFDFRLKLANRKSAEITAFSLEDLYKYTVKELMVIRGQAGFFDIVSKVTETGEPVYTEYFSELRNQWVAFSIKKFNDGYLLNYVDITATKTLEKKAKDQADMLQGILNASITGIITLEAIYDSAGKIDDFRLSILNEAAEKIFAVKEADRNKTYLTLFPNSKSNGFFDLYANALTTGIPVSKEIFYKGEGYNGWYYISVSKMNEHTLVQSFSDITHTRENK